MYSELTPRVLVGGFVTRHVDTDFLAWAGVTHIVNASDQRLPQLVAKQFWTLELDGSNRDTEQRTGYWPKVFSFTREAMRPRKAESKLYFHITPEVAMRPGSPVAVYAGLLALGYTSLAARQKLADLHPILNWHELAMRCVDKSFATWRCTHGKVRLVPGCSPPRTVKKKDDLWDGLDELLSGDVGEAVPWR